MAVHSSELECGKRCVHVGYGEAHVCNPDFPPKGNVLSQPRGVRRDTSGNVINKFCTSALHMKTWWPKVQHLVVSHCKLEQSRLELDSGNCGGSYLTHQDTQSQV